jgi:sugar phosphate isomerase/epimerase
MIGSPTGYMTVGILQAAAFPSSCGLTALRAIAADGQFAAVETTLAGGQVPEARTLLAEAGLLVDFDAGAALYASGGSLCSLDNGVRAHAIGIARECINAAYALEAVRLSVVSGRDPGEPHRAAALDVLIDSLLTLHEYARRSGGLELSLKMADRDIDKRFLIGPTLDGVVVAQRVRERYPEFGLVLNLAHLPLLREDPESAVRLSAPYLARVHIGNCIIGDGDTHPRFGVVGSAVCAADLTRFLRALVSVGYLSSGSRNVVAFEVRPAPDDDPLAVVAESHRVLGEAWASV